MTELRTLIATALKIPVADVHDTTTMAGTSAWDSLAHMEVVLGIEEHYKLRLDGDEIASMLSVAAIAEVLTSRGIAIK